METLQIKGRFIPELDPVPPTESIDIQAPANRRAPIVLTSAEQTELSIFASGRLEIRDEFNQVVISGALLKKLQRFLGAPLGDL